MATETLAVSLLLNANQYKTQARQAATATGQLSNSTGTATTATGKLDKQMSGLATTAKFAVAGVAAGAVVKFGKDSIGAFLDFDDAMNQSLAIMGDVSTTMRDDMANAAREVGKTTRIGADEAAEAYFFLASAGLDAEQSIAALPQVAAFAQAGMFDMATATDLATDAQSALGLTVPDAAKNLENLTRVTDVFTKANELANTSVQQVSEAMTNKAGAAMRAVGIDIEEGTAVLAAFADQGVKGAEAGTQFSIVLRDLQTRAIENKDAFERAGISVFDANGEFRNFADVIGELETRLGGMSDEQKKAELSTLGFTDKSIAALTTLLGTSDAIREYERELRKASGSTQDVANRQLDSYQGKLDLAKGAVEDLQIAIGQGLVPVIADFANTMTTVVGPLSDLIGLFNSVNLGSDEAGESMSIFQAALNALPGMQILQARDQFVDLWDSWTSGTEEASVSTEDFADNAMSLEGELDALHSQTSDYQSTLDDTTGSTDDLTVSVEALKSAEERQARATEAARLAIQKKREDLRNIHDPLFRVVSLNKDLEDAEKAVEEAQKKGVGSDEYRDAIIARAELIADLEDTLIELKEQAIDPTGAAARLMLEDLGIPPGVIDEIFGQFDDLQTNFESRTFRMQFLIPTIDGQDVAVKTGNRIYRQHGGPVRANQVAVVGEDGPELWIPDRTGMVVSNNQMTATGIATGGGMSGPTYVFYGDVYGDEGFMRKVREANVQNGRLGR